MIQIDIPMPRNCSECPCLHWGEYQAFEKSWCAINDSILISKRQRPNGCPLKLLNHPVIMRLIDVDELINEIKKGILEDGNFKTDAEHVIDFVELFTEHHQKEISE